MEWCRCQKQTLTAPDVSASNVLGAVMSDTISAVLVLGGPNSRSPALTHDPKRRDSAPNQLHETIGPVEGDDHGLTGMHSLI